MTQAVAEPSEEELRRYAVRSAYRALATLVVILVVVGLVGAFYEAELLAATRWAHETLGVPGLFVIIALADSVTAPLPPDLVLIVVANTPLSANWWLLVPALGVMSVFAGCGGFVLGRWLGNTRIPRLVLGRFRDKNQALVTRYGALGVAIGALTPVPFSVTCWAAGMFDMPFRAFFPVSLLRVPRYVVYYVAIAYSDDLMRLLF